MGLRDTLKNLNENGIPVPFIRDPFKGKASIVATIFLGAAFMCGLCSVIALASALAKAAGIFASFTDAQQAVTTAFNLSFQFFLAAGGFYVGHGFQRGEKGQISVDSDDKDKP